MPAVSGSQQRLFGMVHAYKKGKLKKAPKKIKEIAEHISEEDAEHFAKTKHKGLPERKSEKKASTKDIGFPEDEIEGLTGRDSIVTHRVSDDAGKYEAGDIVKSPWGDKYEVSDRKDISKIEDSPYYKYLTDSQKALLKVYDRIAVLRLKRQEKKASAKIDIPSVYDEVRRAYADMGYPVSGDRLVLSEQPTYVDGRPVPKDVLNPRSSGGNTQHDGTVRINPRYRAVMRHWKIKGPGRDFLRKIIGHELGHHVDMTVLSKPERAEERKRLLREIAKAKFHTVYTDSYGPDTDPRKLDKELLAEYLAKMVRHKLEKKASAQRSHPSGTWLAFCK